MKKSSIILVLLAVSCAVLALVKLGESPLPATGYTPLDTGTQGEPVTVDSSAVRDSLVAMVRARFTLSASDTLLKFCGKRIDLRVAGVRAGIQRQLYELSAYAEGHVQRMDAYLPYAWQAFSRAGVPQDLAYAGYARTAFVRDVALPDGGAGYWGLDTARACAAGLVVSDSADQRKEFQPSSRAAVKYIRALYDSSRRNELTSLVRFMGQLAPSRDRQPNFYSLPDSDAMFVLACRTVALSLIAGNCDRFVPKWQDVPKLEQLGPKDTDAYQTSYYLGLIGTGGSAPSTPARTVRAGESQPAGTTAPATNVKLTKEQRGALTVRDSDTLTWCGWQVELKNPTVRYYLQKGVWWFAGNRNNAQRWSAYQPYVSTVLYRYSVPTQLDALMFAESQARAYVKNPVSSAFGYWQFLYATGTQYELIGYGLRSGDWCNLERSTDAAAHYLADIGQEARWNGTIYQHLIVLGWHDGEGTMARRLARFKAAKGNNVVPGITDLGYSNAAIELTCRAIAVSWAMRDQARFLLGWQPDQYLSPVIAGVPDPYQEPEYIGRLGRGGVRIGKLEAPLPVPFVYDQEPPQSETRQMSLQDALLRVGDEVDTTSAIYMARPMFLDQVAVYLGARNQAEQERFVRLNSYYLGYSRDMIVNLTGQLILIPKEWRDSDR